MKLLLKITHLILTFCSTLSYAQIQNEAYLKYINEYSQIAQNQQKSHKIPASITLAQGLLESGAGKSYLSLTSNNHFGIKCANWSGEKTYYDDDEKGECFRKYNHPKDSYEDHSIFLTTRQRYAFLFELKPTDYKAWANGLKSAGYATDPNYAQKLISIIETYNLNKFDEGSTYVDPTNSPEIIEKKSSRDNSMGNISAQKSHKQFAVNNVLFVVAEPGDTYASIADEFETSENKLRNYNEALSNMDTKPGQRVFLQKKKKKAPANCTSHTVKAGESMISISTYYGISVVALYKLNNMPFENGAILGQVLKLQ